MSYCLEVVKQDLSQSRIAPLQAIENCALADGEAIIRVDRFGLTANNITYGVAGDMIGYWQFFPAEANWGRIPVWGTGTVINAGGTELSEGAVYYGYFPMGSYLVVKPEQVTARGLLTEPITVRHCLKCITSISWRHQIMVSQKVRSITVWSFFRYLLPASSSMTI